MIMALVATTYMSVAVPANSGEGPVDRYAVIAAPTHPGGNVYEEALAMREYLISRGWNDNEIVFLTDASNEWFVDGISTKFNIENAIRWVAENADENDVVGLILGDRGMICGNMPYIVTSDQELISSHELSTWINEINCPNMLVSLSFDFDGNFIEAIAEPGRLITTSHGLFEETPFNAYSLAEGLRNPLADMNRDGHVSIEEAQSFIGMRMFEFGQSPQMFDGVPGEFIL